MKSNCSFTQDSSSPPSGDTWLREMSRAAVSLEDLSALKLEDFLENKEDLERAAELFDIRVPNLFLDKIMDGNPALSRQFIPSREELIFFPEELEDPIGDEPHTPVEGITHRYPDRVLFKPTYLCGVYCRFCFRRYKVSDSSHNLTRIKAAAAATYIQSHPEIREVILTGGDPLVLPDKILSARLAEICCAEHVRLIRFHTRIPSVLPSRIDEKLVNLLRHTGRTVWIVVHINCVEEFTPAACAALGRLADAGIPLLLQSVLLAGVNDTLDSLTALLKMAIEHRVKPYYLHYPDLARGTSHFRISLTNAINLVRGLRGRISGLCQPLFVIDIPGGKGKIPVDLSFSRQISASEWEFESPLDGSRTRVVYPT